MKDIWSWLDESSDDNAVSPLVNKLMSSYRAKDTEGLRAACEELTQHGKARNKPWLGVFARHWQLQHRLIDLCEGETAVADAVEAFEIAHRDENLGCPQTICSTQDLAIAYSVADGPGYADAIIAACEDTLERINSDWPCFDCVSSELINGLMNSRRFEDAIERVTETEVTIRQTGVNPSLVHLSNHVEAQLELGRNTAALNLASTVDEDRYQVNSEHVRFIYRLHQARAFVRAGHPERATELFAECPSPIAEPAIAHSWAQSVEELIEAGIVENDDRLSSTAVRLAHLMLTRGARRTAFDVAALAARAATARGAKGNSRRSRDLAEHIRAGLVDPAMVDDAMARIDQAIKAMPTAVAKNAPLDQFVDDFEARTDAGESIDEAELHQLIDALRHQGWDDTAKQLLREQMATDPDGPWSALLLDLLLSHGNLDAAEELASQIEPQHPLLALWSRARAAASEGRWVDVSEHCSQIVDADPSAMNTRRLWAVASRQLGDFGSAARLATELLDGWGPEDLDEPSPDLWLAVVCGTLANDWELARRAAAGIGFNLTTDNGPIEEAWESCFITFVADSGQDQTLEAQRTGPATARIVQVSGLNQPQRVGDSVVFDPTPLDPPPDDAEAARFTPVRYASVVTTETVGATAFPIEGPMPSQEQWPTLRDAVFAAGYTIWAYNGGSYELNGERVPYLYAMVAFQPPQSAKDLAELLEELTSTWEPRPFWVQLSEAAEHAADEHKQREDSLWG